MKSIVSRSVNKHWEITIDSSCESVPLLRVTLIVTSQPGDDTAIHTTIFSMLDMWDFLAEQLATTNFVGGIGGMPINRRIRQAQAARSQDTGEVK